MLRNPSCIMECLFDLLQNFEVTRPPDAKSGLEITLGVKESLDLLQFHC